MSLLRIERALLERCLARQWQSGRRAFASASSSSSTTSKITSTVKAPAAASRTRTTPGLGASAVKKPVAKGSAVSANNSSSINTAKVVGSSTTTARSLPYTAAPKTDSNASSPVKFSTSGVRGTLNKPGAAPKAIASDVQSTPTKPIDATRSAVRTNPPATPSPAAIEAIRRAEAREAALRAARLSRAQSEPIVGPIVSEQNKEEDAKAKFKAAQRKWVSTIVALPILIVTSYYLFDRLALGHEQKVMPRYDDMAKKTED